MEQDSSRLLLIQGYYISFLEEKKEVSKKILNFYYVGRET